MIENYPRGHPGAMSARWSPDHLRLHRLLLRRPELLPKGARLVVAVSGGQDSMALAALLIDLQRLHSWDLELWHGDHRWRPESSDVATELAVWSQGQGLPLHLDTWPQPQLDEAAARAWRYGCLQQRAQDCRSSHVLTAHTASDRAETLLLHAARGSHRRGLASLTWSRELWAEPGQAVARKIALVRPLLRFARDDTARICRELALPIWLDPANADLGYSRNRIRSQVLPVLEELHRGATRRISALGERMAEDHAANNELIALALLAVQAPRGGGLLRRHLAQLEPANQRQLLRHWLETQTGPGPSSSQLSSSQLSSPQLSDLVQRLEPARGPGRLDLPGACQLVWDQNLIFVKQLP